MRTFPPQLQKFIAVSFLLVPIILVGCSKSAQSESKSKKAIKNEASEMNPATREDTFLYRAMGGTYVCRALKEEVEFSKAVRIAGVTYGSVISGLHGGFVDEVGKDKLTDKQIMQGSINQVMLAAMQQCPKDVPEDVKTEITEAFKKSQESKDKN